MSIFSRWLTGPLISGCLCIGLGAQAPAQVISPQQGDVINQTLGNTGDRILDDTGAAIRPNTELAPLPDDRGAPSQGQAISAEDAARTMLLQDVVLEGNDVFDTDEFVGLWSELRGEQVTIGALARIADDIQTYYRKEGYVFTRAVLLSDRFGEGVALIRVVEGVIGEVTVEESDEPVGPVLDLLQRMGERLEGVRSPHIRDLERVLLIMNDVPGIKRATAVPRRATSGDPGLINVVINVERKPLAGIVFADNRQAPSAGQGILGLSGEYASYSPDGDTTRLTFLNSFWSTIDDLNERRIFQVEHSRYVGADGLTVFLRGLYSTTDLGDELERLEIEGQQYQVEAGLAYPVIRTRPLTLNATASFEFSESQNDVLGGVTRLTDDSLRIFTVGLDALMRDSMGYTSAELKLEKGFSFLGGSEQGDANLSRGDGDPKGFSVYGSIERDQKIYGGFSTFVRADAQWSSNEMVASREYQAGGTTIGRGYDPSELTGDVGAGVSAELRYTQPLDVLGVTRLNESAVQFYAFYDYAWIYNFELGQNPDENISSFGGGFRMELPEDVILEFEVAKPLDPLQRNNEDNIRFFFEAQKRF